MRGMILVVEQVGKCPETFRGYVFTKTCGCCYPGVGNANCGTDGASLVPGCGAGEFTGGVLDGQGRLVDSWREFSTIFYDS
jgi:hypothetical protein